MKKNSKTIIFCLFGILALIIGYLILANFSIYYRINQADLITPDSKYAYTIGGDRTNSTSMVYAALGDSLTSGVGVDKYERSFPYLLALKLSQQKQAQIDLRTFAYPGARTADFIENLLGPAIAAKPDIVTLLIGTNDIHGNVGIDQFRANYDHILGRLTKETQAKIYLISIPYIGSDELMLPPLNYYFQRQARVYNEIIISLAEKYDLRYIDINNPTFTQSQKNEGYYSRDLFHPSSEGYRLWAQIIYDNDINR